MNSIQDHLFDTEFLENSLDYLSQTLNIRASILDDEGNTLLSKGASCGCAERFYGFDFDQDIGGLRCQAEDEQILEQAEPHIQYCMASINSQLQREIELREISDEMLQLSEQLNFLSKMSGKIIGVDKLQSCYEIAMEEIALSIKASQAFVYSLGLWADEITLTLNMEQKEAEEIRRCPFMVKYQDSTSTIIGETADGRSLLYAPVREKNNVINGQMVFLRPAGTRQFTAYEKTFVGIIENIISPTFETLRLYNSLRDLYLNTVKALAAAIDAKDEYTHGHSRRVAEYAVAIGRQLGLDEKDLGDLEISAFMHDLGKIGISEIILGKPDKLTMEEFTHIQQHPQFTDRILKPIHLTSNIVAGAIQHHERLDGTGYPLGLAGEEISVFGRIIAVADVFDALTSKRPYRDAMTVEAALKILCNDIDSHFDRKMVLALIEAMQTDLPQGRFGSSSDELRYETLQNLNEFLKEVSTFITTVKPTPVYLNKVES